MSRRRCAVALSPYTSRSRRNRAHLVTGEQALQSFPASAAPNVTSRRAAPQLRRDDRELDGDRSSVARRCTSRRQRLLSEPAIVSRASHRQPGRRAMGGSDGRILTGFATPSTCVIRSSSGCNERARVPGGFHTTEPSAPARVPTATGKARFTVHPLRRGSWHQAARAHHRSRAPTSSTRQCIGLTTVIAACATAAE